MKTVLACVCLALSAGAVKAQYYQAVQQAQRANDQNNAEQRQIRNESGGGAPAPAQPAPAPMPAVPMDPALQATLKNVAGLQADFTALVTAATTNDPAQKVSLLNDLTQAAQGAKKASTATVKQLAGDLMAALAGQKKLTAAQQKPLAQKIHALFNSAHLTDAQQQALLDGIQKTLTDAGVSLDAAINVTVDLKAVIAETK